MKNGKTPSSVGVVNIIGMLKSTWSDGDRAQGKSDTAWHAGDAFDDTMQFSGIIRISLWKL
jgi:hypothetical protein